jgi:hypothetical protein
MANALPIIEKLKISQSIKAKTYSFAGITLGVIVFLLIFAVRPTLSTITRIITEVNEKKEIDSMLTSKIDSLNALERQFLGDATDPTTGLKSQFKDISLIYPAKGDFSFIMDSIETLCREDGFYVSSINFQSPSSSEPSEVDNNLNVLRPWKLILSVKGNKANIVNLMQDLESLPNYPVVERMSFSNQTDSSGETVFSLQVKVYKVEEMDFYNLDALFGTK